MNLSYVVLNVYTFRNIFKHVNLKCKIVCVAYLKVRMHVNSDMIIFALEALVYCVHIHIYIV